MEPKQIPEDLLADVEPEERKGRKAILAWLLERGVGVDQLREAASKDRLALLPTELVLNRGCNYSLEEAAESSGLDRDFIAKVWRAAGIPVPGADDPILGEEDLEAMQMARRVLDAGIPEEAYIEISRVVGRGATTTAQSLVEMSIERFLEPGEDESAFAMRLEEVAEQLTPLLPTLLAFPVRMHLRDAVRHQALERRGAAIGSLARTRRMAIGFADLVGYTELSERATLAESGNVARRLEELASTVAEPPVRLVKLIGDAAMLVSDETLPLAEAMSRLKQAAGRTAELPELRIGLAAGEVAPRAGDVYGPAVNLASRLAGIGEPGEVLAPADLADEISTGFETRKQQPRDIKGVGQVQIIELVGPRGSVS